MNDVLRDVMDRIKDLPSCATEPCMTTSSSHRAITNAWKCDACLSIVVTAAFRGGRGYQIMARHMAKLAAPITDEVAMEAVRAGGDVLCQTCRLPYIDHSESPEYPFLRILCDGRRVKL